MSPANLSRIALAETISWSLLIVATILKYAADWPVGVQLIGPIHGILFVALIGVAYMVMQSLDWGWSRFAKIVLASILPVYGYILIHQEAESAHA